MNPLLSFGPLPTDIEHAVCEVADNESGLSDTGSLDTRAQDILIVRDVICCGDTVYRVEVAKEDAALVIDPA